jgi:aminomethyltransferase
MENKRTCLYDRHVALGAQISAFGGFDMPIQYAGITEEHQAVRQRCGVFDVSHMGEVEIGGADAERFVNHLFTNDVSGMPVGKILYGMMCYDDGGVVDDLLVYKTAGGEYLLVINAANIAKDLEWIRQQADGFGVVVTDRCDYYGELAVQGPEAERIMEEVLGLPCSELAFYTFKQLLVAADGRPADTGSGDRQPVLVSRTGYTGEDGFEIYGQCSLVCRYWDRLMEAGVQPCGLGCRDTLRFEVGLPLYGDELSADISPIMAGLGMFVKLDKDGFIGKEALARQKAEGVERKIVGIELLDKAIPRHGYAVLKDGEQIGEVTTGYHTISTDRSVCMALVDTRYAQLGTPVDIQIRKKVFPGMVVKKKFYDKHYKK